MSRQYEIVRKDLMCDVEAAGVLHVQLRDGTSDLDAIWVRVGRLVDAPGEVERFIHQRAMPPWHFDGGRVVALPGDFQGDPDDDGAYVALVWANGQVWASWHHGKGVLILQPHV